MANIQKYLEEATMFFNSLATELGNPENTDQAYRLTSAFFHTLRERITVVESFHFISQLPLILKGIYVDGWKPSEYNKSETVEEFLYDVRQHSLKTASIDFGSDQEARDNIEAVIRILRHYISDGEIEHVKAQLPPAIAELFKKGDITA
jgi:uncharacterized protein (DUF2267 family)